jgi:hypothetical protein
VPLISHRRRVSTVLDIYLDEEHGERHGEVALCAEGDVSVAHLEVVEGQHALAQQLVVVVVHPEPKVYSSHYSFLNTSSTPYAPLLSTFFLALLSLHFALFSLFSTYCLLFSLFLSLISLSQTSFHSSPLSFTISTISSPFLDPTPFACFILYPFFSGPFPTLFPFFAI